MSLAVILLSARGMGSVTVSPPYHYLLDPSSSPGTPTGVNKEFQGKVIMLIDDTGVNQQPDDWSDSPPDDTKPDDSSRDTTPPGESPEEKEARIAKENEELERKNAGLKKEQQDLMTDISRRRAERRSLSPTSSSEPQKADDQQPSETELVEQAKVRTVVAEATEKRAIREFIKKHPEYEDEARWRQVASTYVSRKGKMLWEDIMDDLEDAHLLLNKDSIMQEAAKKAEGEAARKLHEADRADIGGTSTSAPKGVEAKLSADELKTFEKMRKVDPTLTEEKFLKAKQKRLGS